MPTRSGAAVHTYRAPARIDLAGGTLDIFPISQLQPGAVTVNLAIDRWAVARARALDGERFVLAARDRGVRERHAGRAALAADGTLALHREVALHVGPPAGLELATRSGVPAGSGLGGSSTLLVAMLKAAAAARGGSLGAARILRLATDLEARVIGVPTGTQDHVGALYGGLSAVTFPPGGTKRTAVRADVAALARRLVLVYTGLPHDSAVNNWEITKRFVERDKVVRRHLGAIAGAARDLLAALGAGDLDAAGAAMQREWEARKQLAPGVTTRTIERIGRAAKKAGALGMKVCGAGGGGCVVLFAAAGRRAAVARAATDAGGQVLRFRPATQGVHAVER
jgi:D-glycero-alpha-D-manno-heptose-7-phosphate kinase